MKKLFIILIILLAPAWCGATTYYVKHGGNNSLAGTSDATAWETLAKVNSGVSGTSDKVYLKCGDTWSNQSLAIDWSGTGWEGNEALVGSYYMDGTETIGVNGDGRPIIEGTLHTVVGGEITVPGYPTTIQTPLISLRGSYITLTNIEIKNSGGYFSQAAGPIYGNNHFKFINVKADTATDAGFVFRDVDDVEITACDVTKAGYGRVVQNMSQAWGAAVALITTTNTNIHKNIVHENYGEGINHNTGASSGLVEYNEVYGNRAVQVYLDGANNIVVKHNKIYGITDTNYHRTTGYSGYGIYIADEQYNGDHDTSGNEIYGNTIAYCWIGFFTGNNMNFDDINFYNNSVSNCKIAVYMYYTTFSNSNVKNNIFWQGGGESLYGGSSVTTGITWDYNNWSSSVNSGQSGSNDVIGNPDFTKTTGWQSLTGGDLSISDFGLTSESPGLNVGENLGVDYDEGLSVTSVLPDSPVLFNRDSYGVDWEIGAIPYAGGISLSGTLIPDGSISELTIQTESTTLIITLGNSEWVAMAGDDNLITDAIIAGITGNLSTDTSWNTIVILDHTMIEKTSDTVLTITLPAFATYDILQTETVSTTMPATATTAGVELSASVFYISALDEVVEGKRMLAPSNENGKQIFYSATGSMILQPQ